jgi:L-ascorbate metabolism protein UlaG (beta-lactamase superfamily)
MKTILKIIFIITIFSSCKGIQHARKFKNEVISENVSFSISKNPTDSIRFYYSGCSGFYIKKGQNGLLHDPFLSNNGPLLKLNTSKLKIDTTLISKYFTRIIGKNYDAFGEIKALIASHTHYDHVLDFPEIIDKHLNTDSTLIGGDIGLKWILNLNSKEKKLFKFKNLTSQASDSVTLKQWVEVKNHSIRILPILSEHAPHYFGMKFFGGNIDSTQTNPISYAAQFKQGQSLSYLIDFMEKGQPVFRIYIQGSASQSPAGFPPQLLDNKGIDVAILCVASYRYVHDYPEEILNRLRPKYVILSHWENFFNKRTSLQQTPAEVPFTDVNKFLTRFKKQVKLLNINGYSLIASDTFLNIKFLKSHLNIIKLTNQ